MKALIQRVSRAKVTVDSEVTGEIQIINQTIYSAPDSMFQIRNPERDIRVTMRKKTNLNV